MRASWNLRASHDHFVRQLKNINQNLGLSTTAKMGSEVSSQFGILLLGVLQDGDVGIGVFPKTKKSSYAERASFPCTPTTESIRMDSESAF